MTGFHSVKGGSGIFYLVKSLEGRTLVLERFLLLYVYKPPVFMFAWNLCEVICVQFL